MVVTKMLTLAVALIVAGIVALVMVPVNMSAQMDRVDAAGTSGNIFEFDILPLSVLALGAIVAGIVVGVRAIVSRERT
jgi:uncharacterized integral membrane protein